MEKTGCIYYIQNKINGKMYIGKTIRNLHVRYERHCADAFVAKSDLVIHRAMRKYGKEAFKLGVIDRDIPQKLMSNLEINRISEYETMTYQNGYNVAYGGEGGRSNNIINLHEVKEITDLLTNTNFTMKELGKYYKISMSAVSDLNRGKSWYDNTQVYPIRKSTTKRSPKIHDNIVKGIVEELKRKDIKTLGNIAKKYGVMPGRVYSINKGSIYVDKELEYPIRKQMLGKDSGMSEYTVLSIMESLKNSTETKRSISERLGVGYSNILDIDKGRTWKRLWHGEYPIRKVRYNNEIMQSVVNRLMHTNMTYKEICMEFDLNKNYVSSINKGRNNAVSKVYRGDFPIRQKK